MTSQPIPAIPECWPSTAPATVGDIVAVLTAQDAVRTRYVVEALRSLWHAGLLAELAMIYRAVQRRYVRAVVADCPADERDAARQAAASRMYKLLTRATCGSPKALRPYFRERGRLTDSQRERFARLWQAAFKPLRGLARNLDPRRINELLSDTAERILKPHVFAKLAPDYDPDCFRWLAIRCMKMAHRSHRQEDRRQERRVGRYFIREGRRRCESSLHSRVAETAERLEALGILLDRIAGLCGRQRDAVISAYLDGESREDIARRWGQSRNAVNSAVGCGVRNLRKTVPESLDPGGLSGEDVTRRMAALRRQGLSFARIAVRFGVDPAAVQGRIGRLAGKAVAR